jgi:Xaa-Pro aminopeptidase
MDKTIAGRVAELQDRMAGAAIDLAVLSDADSVVYFSGFANYLAMEFGRATVLVVARDGEPVLITPAQEAEMGAAMTGLGDIRGWSDGIDDEWRKPLRDCITAGSAKRIAYETEKTHPSIARVIESTARECDAQFDDLSGHVGAMRLVKTADEIAVMRQAGQVAVAMVQAARETIGIGVPEYEVALAVIAGGTRKAAAFLANEGPDVFCAPTIYNLQVLQSGHHTSMVHRRASTRRIGAGDPIYLCFCGIANFRHFKLGFDREFWAGSVTDEQARAYETIVTAQQAALAEIRPGALAGDVHAAANEIYLSAGHGPAYRTGRAIGYSFLEKPELKDGDQTRLQAGMTFAVDGGLGVEGQYGTRIGDSIVVTEGGFDYLTDYPRELAVI